jgi:methylenetetrahydrofolate reductase (NADPH)
MNPRWFLDDYSLEITAGDVGRLGSARADIPLLTLVSITFLPRDNVDDLARVAASVRQLGFVPVPHISARRIKSRDELVRFLSRLRDEADVTRVFVIAGDPSSPLGPYDDALSVIRSGLLADYGVHHVGIAGYPEGHRQITEDRLSRALHSKLAAIRQAGQSAEIVTQFVFDAEAVLTWLGRLRAEGADATLRVGLPGPASVQSLLRFAARCGVGASAKVIAKYGASISQLLSTATPDLLVNTLAERIDPTTYGSVKAHLYPFGGIGKAAEWAAAFSVREPAQ